MKHFEDFQENCPKCNSENVENSTSMIVVKQECKDCGKQWRVD